tara:strand:+ start:4855 stop:5025 length:171 start_codon:yes stop_codon:yes gene_type:complete
MKMENENFVVRGARCIRETVDGVLEHLCAIDELILIFFGVLSLFVIGHFFGWLASL